MVQELGWAFIIFIISATVLVISIDWLVRHIRKRNRIQRRATYQAPNGKWYIPGIIIDRRHR